MKHTALLVLAVMGLAILVRSPITWAADERNISSVNGGITASAGKTYGSLSTVNGDIHVERGAIADHAKTVNGGITVESTAKIGELNTVNGSLEIGDDVTIERAASTVNGGVELGRRTHVGGDISTVSGEIELKGAEVGGRLNTRNGDIDLSDGARVHGGILVKKKSDDSWGRSNGDDDPLHVHICSTCVVEGELRFERAVELRVDQGAKIGQVIGDKVTRR
jgi:DUF4097 and DUF4098 domain-containing protein YvlB